jgi:hypothetical protein
MTLANQRYMREMIKDRLSSVKEERYDLFSSLLDANEGESASAMLAERELLGELFDVPSSPIADAPLGNIFVFLLAGHEVRHSACNSTLYELYMRSRLHIRCVLHLAYLLCTPRSKRSYINISNPFFPMAGLQLVMIN